MRSIYKLSADIIFVIHAFVFLTILFGWAFPSIWYIYISLLVVTLLSDLIFGFCPISKWEFLLRKKIDPKLSYNYQWTSYYTRKITDENISPVFFSRIAVVFIVLSLAVNYYFY